MQENESVVQIPLEYFDRLRKIEESQPYITIKYTDSGGGTFVDIRNATDAMLAIKSNYDKQLEEVRVYNTVQQSSILKHNILLQEQIEKLTIENRALKTRKRKFFGLF